jgi:hypothetical protein
MLTGLYKQLAESVISNIHADQKERAAKDVLRNLQIKKQVNSIEAANQVLTFFLHDLMDHGGMAEAARMLWTPSQFTPEPQSVKELWDLWDTSDMALVMGAASMGKSFSLGARAFLEWVRDPEWTGIRVLGPSEKHLEANLFSHLVSLHASASLPMPGEIGELFIGISRRDQLAAITGVVIPKGNVRKAGRLQGGKRRPRLKVHPVFGPMSRMFIFIDEIENVPLGCVASGRGAQRERNPRKGDLSRASNERGSGANCEVRGRERFPRISHDGPGIISGERGGSGGHSSRDAAEVARGIHLV